LPNENHVHKEKVLNPAAGPAETPPQGVEILSEQVLIGELLAGDRKAIGEFIRRYSDTVYAFVHRRLDQPGLADDFVQEVFVAVWRKLSEFRGDSTLTTWLCAIARYKIADYYRERFQQLLSLDDPEFAGPTPEALIVNEDFIEQIDRNTADTKAQTVLAAMPEALRAVLLWRYWDERPLADMAQITGKTPKAMERLLARARADFTRRWNHG
jgi:RNA polymerase sigma-70 factor (ECF subfamily)